MHAKVLKPIVFVLVVMAVVSLACLGGAGTPAPEPTPVIIEATPQQVEQPAQPVITEEPVQTEEPVPTEEPAPAAQDFFTEEFEGDISNWSYFNILGSDETNESALTLETDGGYLVFDIPTKQLYTYVM